MRWLTAGVCGSLALGVACRGQDWIIAGELPTDAELPDGERPSPELVADPGACPSSLELLEQRRQEYAAGSVAASHVGRWRGTLGDSLDSVAAAGFPGIALALEIDASGAGTLRFDADTSDRLQAGSDEGYLCSAETLRVVCGSDSGFVGGFAYPVLGTRSRDGVLTFSIALADPWGSWCAEHEPVSWEDPIQACGVAFGVLPSAELRFSERGCSRVTPDGAEPIDCALMYALDYCQCARDGCFARLDRTVVVGLTLSQDGTALGGSLWYEDRTDAARIELRRAP